MPDIDPNIALGVNPPTAQNPLAAISQYLPFIKNQADIANIGSEIQSRQLQQAQLMRTMRGQNALAEAASQSVDPDTGEVNPEKWASTAAQNPLTAGLAGTLLQQVREAQLARMNMAAKQQEMVTKGIGDMSQIIAAGATNPDTIVPRMQAYIKSQPKEIRDQLREFADDTYRGLFDNLPSNPNLSDAENKAQRGQVVQQRLDTVAKQYLSDTQRANIYGTPVSRDDGNRIWQGQQNNFTGAVQWNSNPVVRGLAPSVAPLDSIIQGGVRGGPQFLQPTGPTNSLTQGAAPPPAPSGNALGVAPPGPVAPPPTTPASGPVSWATGKPLQVMQDPNVVPGRATLGGQVQLRNPKLDESDKLGSDGEYTKTFQNAQIAMQQFQELQATAQHLGSDKFLSPGVAGNARLSLVKGWNAFQAMTGIGKPYDPTDAAAAEDIQKNSYRLGISSLTQMLGAQREAAQTIERMFSATPGLENSPLGLQLLLSSVKASSQLAMDRYKYMSAWAGQNHALSTAAETEFEKQSPPSAYAMSALHAVGLGENGWESPEAVRNAYSNKWITKDQAKVMLKNQFGDTPK